LQKRQRLNLAVVRERHAVNSEFTFIRSCCHSVLAMLDEVPVTKREGAVFDATNLRVSWEQACAKCGLGTRVEMKSEAGNRFFKYQGLLVHDLRRSAVRNLRLAGTPEDVAMRISGHKTRAIFSRYNIVSTDDISEAMRRVEAAAAKMLPRGNGVTSVAQARRKSLKAAVGA